VTMTVTEETSQTTEAGALPAGVFHLLAADDDVTTPWQGYVTLCGEVLVSSGLPVPCWSEEAEPYRNAQYCPDCVRQAVRFSAEEAGVSGE
jgi:hypothetical protein